MKNGRWLVASVGFLAAALAAPAAAQDDSGLYLGGSLGYSQYKDSCKMLIVPCDGNDTAWRAFAGYQFNRYVALEAGFANLGEVTGSGIFNTGTPGNFSVAVDEAWDLTAVFLIPVTSRLSGLARVGMYRARTTIDVSNEGFPDIHEAGTNSGFSYGAGAEFRLGPIGLRAEWQRYENVGVAATGEDDIDVLSLGLLLRF
ncbi:MAG TPA: outer membrane beta-barrel protein [Burkholderiales bacterium]|nr:outer membrane beta-barrel protein [Burkholderiales bacterium]